jgi:DNA (cytosine-5)-methyltransferase 1
VSVDKSIQCVDLFCGAGGLTHGLRKVGISVKAGLDLDESCRFPYEKNNAPAKFYAADVGALDGDIVRSMFTPGRIRLLAGCAPCQPFSTYSLGKTKKTDRRWSLLGEFSRLVKEVRPELVTMENVPKLRAHPIFGKFVTDLQALGYFVSSRLVDCRDYGVPQSRRRLVLMASLLGEVMLREPGHQGDRPRTVRRTIGMLPSIDAGGVSTKDPLHRSSGLTAVNLQRLRASSPGGTWRDWNNDLVAPCHKAESGKTFSSVYGRMAWDKPSPTITTQFYGFGNGRFGHPEQDRAISLREGALLQTFPRSYKFVDANDSISLCGVGELIGNAVPVRLGEVIGQSFLIHLKNKSSKQKGTTYRKKAICCARPST